MTLSVYVHIPFCSRRCDYCDFATWVDKNDSVEKYFDSVKSQWSFHVEQLNGRDNVEIDSIFFGGGTPNYVDARYIAELIELIQDGFQLVKECEVTVECNPDHVTKEKLQTYKNSGVNRISLGVQSTKDHVLKFLGREHNPDHVRKSRELISQSGIDNVSADLIYGSAVESIEDWHESLLEVTNLDVNHLSAYALGIESRTPLGIEVRNGIKQNVQEDDLADKYELADKFLSENGFSWYEISNWAKPGKQSRHNLNYWLSNEVIALGCAAHGFTNNQRWSTPRNIDLYIERFSRKTPDKLIDWGLFNQQDNRSSIGRQEEAFALKLRTRLGVSLPKENYSIKVQNLIDEGFIFIENRDNEDFLVLTVKGRLMEHAISIELYNEIKQLT